MIKLGSKTVGKYLPPYFIADIGSNHNGDLDTALRLVELAKESRADAVKFQLYTADKLLSPQGLEAYGKTAAHQQNWPKPVYETMAEASLPAEWLPRLKEKCEAAGIELMLSAYDFASVDAAEPYTSAYKVGSGEITWPAMLAHVASKKKPVLLSTGASNMEEVELAAAVFPQRRLVIMQCNTNYTGERDNFKSINLHVLKVYAQRFPEAVLGLSDHTQSNATVLGAIALGARVIEKHFTADAAQTGPDHAFSLMPEQFKEMVDVSMELYEALGDGVKHLEANEQEAVVLERRGLYYTRDMAAGEAPQAEDLQALRPALPEGVKPYQESDILGKPLTQAVKAGAPAMQQDFA